MLRQLKFENIDEALELLKHKKYDLIISDWNMEPMNGIELLKAQDAITKIYENCTFQDLTGQRIKKFSQILNGVYCSTKFLLNTIYLKILLIL